MRSSPNIFQVTKSRIMRWAGHETLMGRGDVYSSLWLRNIKERKKFGDLCVDLG